MTGDAATTTANRMDAVAAALHERRLSMPASTSQGSTRCTRTPVGRPSVRADSSGGASIQSRAATSGGQRRSLIRVAHHQAPSAASGSAVSQSSTSENDGFQAVRLPSSRDDRAERVGRADQIDGALARADDEVRPQPGDIGADRQQRAAAHHLRLQQRPEHRRRRRPRRTARSTRRLRRRTMRAPVRARRRPRCDARGRRRGARAVRRRAPAAARSRSTGCGGSGAGGARPRRPSRRRRR